MYMSPWAPPAARLAALLVSGGLVLLAQPPADPRALIALTIAHQHADDLAVYQFEHIERRIRFSDGAIASDRTYRVVPTGTGTLSLLLRRGNQPVAPAEYQQALRNWEQVLLHAINPRDPFQQQSLERRQQRDRERASLIDAIPQALIFSPAGEERQGGRLWTRFRFEPNPRFRPNSRLAEMFRHVRGTAWIDRDAAQLARATAEIISDISIGGGIAGQIDRGGWFHIEQAPVAAGVWLPVRIEYAISGRKFLFSFREHLRTDATCYRWIGSPADALRLVRIELAGGALPAAADPTSCGSAPAAALSDETPQPAAAAASFSIGTPTRFPHSVQDPS